MKEIYELHAKVLALQSDLPANHPVNFSRVEIEDDKSLLTAGLIEELKTLQGQISLCLPDDVDYFAFVGGAEAPVLDLVVEDFPSSLPHDTPLLPDQSLFPQLTSLDWEKLRDKAASQHDRMQAIIDMVLTTTRAPRSTKAVQKDFKEDTKEFIREKRADASKIHVLLWSGVEDDRLLLEEFSIADELRERLPRILLSGGEVVTIVAFGKPLPIEKIDALMSEAHRKTGAVMHEIFDNARQQMPPGDGIIDVESTVADGIETTQD